MFGWTKPPEPTLTIAWAVQSEIPDCVRIDHMACRVAWPDKILWRWMNRPTSYVLAARLYQRIVGYALASRYGNRLSLVRIAVDPAHLRTGVGTALVDRLKDTAMPGHGIQVMTREGDLELSMFLRRLGFSAVLVPDLFQEPDEDGLAWGWAKPAADVMDIQRVFAGA